MNYIVPRDATCHKFIVIASVEPYTVLGMSSYKVKESKPIIINYDLSYMKNKINISKDIEQDFYREDELYNEYELIDLIFLFDKFFY